MMMEITRGKNMIKTYEDDKYIRYEDSVQVRIEYKSVGAITSLKHTPEWHKEFMSHKKLEGCIYCIQPERSKREDSLCELCKESPHKNNDDLCESCRECERYHQFIYGNYDEI